MEQNQRAHQKDQRFKGPTSPSFSQPPAEVHLKPSQFDIREKTKLQRPLNLTEVYEFTQTVVGICGDLERFITDDLWPLLSSEEKSAESAPGHSPKSDSQ